jgi:hypothetical protein
MPGGSGRFAPRGVTKTGSPAAVEILGPCLNGIIFEQEYHVKNDRIPISKLALDLDEFFSKIPEDKRYHIELRSESYREKAALVALRKAKKRDIKKMLVEKVGEKGRGEKGVKTKGERDKKAKGRNGRGLQWPSATGLR